MRWEKFRTSQSDGQQWRHSGPFTGFLLLLFHPAISALSFISRNSGHTGNICALFWNSWSQNTKKVCWKIPFLWLSQTFLSFSGYYISYSHLGIRPMPCWWSRPTKWALKWRSFRWYILFPVWCRCFSPYHSVSCPTASDAKSCWSLDFHLCDGLFRFGITGNVYVIVALFAFTGSILPLPTASRSQWSLIGGWKQKGTGMGIYNALLGITLLPQVWLPVCCTIKWIRRYPLLWRFHGVAGYRVNGNLFSHKTKNWSCWLNIRKLRYSSIGVNCNSYNAGI